MLLTIYITGLVVYMLTALAARRTIANIIRQYRIAGWFSLFSLLLLWPVTALITVILGLADESN